MTTAPAGQNVEPSTPTPMPTTTKRGVLRAMLRLVAFVSLVLLALALVGHVVRDRTRWLALLMYLPLVLVAPFAIVAHAAAFEPRLWKRRLLLVTIAAVAFVVASVHLRGGRSRPSSTRAVRVVQWNVQWGNDEPGWAATMTQIERAAPDVLALSEAPSDAKIAALCARLGPQWNFRRIRNPQRGRYWFAVAVLSHWPIVDEQAAGLPNGVSLRVTVDAPDLRWRVLAVDGMSDPMIARTPMLHAVARACADAAARGEPIDVVAGDFNAVSRSVGFDALAGAGYTLASRACRGWRGTFPSFLPAYDIDHVWLGGAHVAASCAMLDSPGTNHRGQLVHVDPSAAK